MRDPSGLAGPVRTLTVLDPAEAEGAAFAILRDSASLDAGKAKAQADVASSLMRQALTLFPYYPPLVAMLGKIGGLSPHPPGFAAWLRALKPVLRGLPQTDEGAEGAALARAGGDPDGLARLARQTGNPGLAARALLELWRDGQARLLVEAAPGFAATPAGSFLAPVLARAMFQAGEADLARTLLEAAPPNSLTHELGADMRAAHGDAEGERAALRTALAFEPGLPHAVRRLAGLRAASRPGADAPVALLLVRDDPGAVRFTLDSLQNRRLPPRRTVVLDNGSQGGPAEELAAVVRDRAGLLRMPTDIGDPAARQWFWRLLEEEGQGGLLLIARAGAGLPENGLSRLAGSLASSELATSVAPKIVAAPGPSALRHGPLRLVRGGEGVEFYEPGAHLPDRGRLDCLGPTASAGPDIRLYDLDRLRRLHAPGFDLRYAPGGLEVLDHDLVCREAGGLTLFEGRVRAWTTGRGRVTEFAATHLAASRLKLECKFGPRLDCLEAATAVDTGEDFAACLETAEAEMPLSARDFWRELAG